ncbi:MAG TPA: hypothetical protein VLG48_13980 [Candidatus Methylomirabilis sp.]|nr:hypothetical protein [Candidatus Methylomirabilis sp.]
MEAAEEPAGEAAAKVVAVPELATAEGIPAVVDAATPMLVAAADSAGVGQTTGVGPVDLVLPGPLEAAGVRVPARLGWVMATPAGTWGMRSPMRRPPLLMRASRRHRRPASTTSVRP